MRMWTRTAIPIAAAIALVGSLVSPTAAAEPVHVADLAPGESVYWDGGHVGYSPVYSLPAAPSNALVDRCATTEPCFEFTLGVLEAGAQLRVALDTPMRDDGFELILRGPSGENVRVTNGNQYSVEATAFAPTAGEWRITVAPYSAEHATFRMRAKLEAEPYRPTPDAEGRFLPNLRVMRLWEFGFVAPANPFNGLFPPDDLNPPLDAAGYHPLSCAADEMFIGEGGNGDTATRCLRYSFGLANLGPGPFDVRWTGDRVGEGSHEMTQCVQRSDGTVEGRPAGTGSFHKTHGHWHYDDVVFHELLKVTDREAGAMEAAGKGKKLGYSPADQAIAEWSKFIQAPAGTSGSAGNCAPGSNSRLGMSAGWGDAYRYQRPGNYVEFGANGDGHYVVRTIADPLDVLLETDETDNTSYVYLHVVGEDIEVIEAGRGDSPWDPDKVVYDYPLGEPV